MDNQEQNNFDEVLQAIVNVAVASVNNTSGSMSSKDVSDAIKAGTVNFIKNVFNSSNYSSFKSQFKDKIVTPLFEVINKKISKLDIKMKLDISKDLENIFSFTLKDKIEHKREFNELFTNALQTPEIKTKISEDISNKIKINPIKIEIENIKGLSNIFKFNKEAIKAIQLQLTDKLKDTFDDTFSDKLKDKILKQLTPTGVINFNLKSIESLFKSKLEKLTEKDNITGITSLLGGDYKLMLPLRIKYNILMWKMLGKISTAIEKLQFKSKDEKGNDVIDPSKIVMDVSSLLDFPKQLGFYNRYRYGVITREILNQISTVAVEGLRFRSINQVTGKEVASKSTMMVDIASLLSFPKELGMLNRFQYGRTINNLLTKIKVGVNKMKFISPKLAGTGFELSDELRFDIRSLFRIDKVDITEYIKKLLPKSVVGESTNNAIIPIISKKEPQAKTKQPIINPTISKIDMVSSKKEKSSIPNNVFTMMYKYFKKQEETQKETDVFEKKPEMIVTDIGDNAIKKIKNVFSKKEEPKYKTDKKTDNQMGGLNSLIKSFTPLMGGIKSLLGGILGKGLAIAGAGAAGYAIGTLINNNVMKLFGKEGKLSDKIGDLFAKRYGTKEEIENAAKLREQNKAYRETDEYKEKASKIREQKSKKSELSNNINLEKPLNNTTEDEKFKNIQFTPETQKQINKILKVIDKSDKQDKKESDKHKQIEPTIPESSNISKEKTIIQPVQDYKAFINPKGQSVKFDPKDYIRVEASKKASPSIFSSKESDELKKLFTEIRDILKQSGTGIFGINNLMGDLNKTSKTGFKDLVKKPVTVFPPAIPGLSSPVQLTHSADGFRMGLNPAY